MSLRRDVNHVMRNKWRFFDQDILGTKAKSAFPNFTMEHAEAMGTERQKLLEPDLSKWKKPRNNKVVYRYFITAAQKALFYEELVNI